MLSSDGRRKVRVEVELSLSGRDVTIGTSALAYLARCDVSGGANWIAKEWAKGKGEGGEETKREWTRGTASAISPSYRS